ncbi:MAG TPA: hypothetical protein PKB02_12460 [Anaerohalosphaeraceae bacterium]|nr:hypothetical protein [Anaerohalosphaeraceae bacterium]
MAIKQGKDTLMILILLEIIRFGEAKKLSAASFQQQHYHRGYAEQIDPVSTRGIKRPAAVAE